MLSFIDCIITPGWNVSKTKKPTSSTYRINPVTLKEERWDYASGRYNTVERKHFDWDAALKNDAAVKAKRKAADEALTPQQRADKQASGFWGSLFDTALSFIDWLLF